MKRIVIAFLCVASILAFSACGRGKGGDDIVVPENKPVAENNFYTNPIFPIVNGEKKSTYQADPYIVRDDDGTYYMYCTQTDVYTPGVAFKRGPVWKSVDMHS